MNPEGEGVQDKVSFQSTCGFSMCCLSGGESSIGRGPVHAGGLGLWQVGVVDVDTGSVAVGRNVVNCSIVDLKMNSSPRS